MALLEGSLYAESLGMNTGITASIPGERRDETGDMPVLYLLHGLSDDHTSWVRRTDIDRYAGGVGRGGDHARGTAQLLLRHGVWAAVFHVYSRRAAAALPAPVPGIRPAGGQLRGWAVHGRLRRDKGRAGPSGTFCRRCQLLGSGGCGRPGRFPPGHISRGLRRNAAGAGRSFPAGGADAG